MRELHLFLWLCRSVIKNWFSRLFRMGQNIMTFKLQDKEFRLELSRH